jgi:hypothetical protein
MNIKFVFSSALVASLVVSLFASSPAKAQSDSEDVTYAAGAPVYRAKITKFTVSWYVPVYSSNFGYITHKVTAEGQASWNTGNLGSGWGDLYGFAGNSNRTLIKTTSSRSTKPPYTSTSPYNSDLSGNNSINYSSFSYRITAWDDNTAEIKATDLMRIDFRP